MPDKKHGPWTIHSSKKVYTNPWIEVWEDKVTRPDGKPGVYGTVKWGAGASALPIDDEGNIYLTKEFRYGIGEDSIEVVSGGVDDGEKPVDAAKRELKEELGIEANEWIDLGTVHPFTSIIRSPAYLFLARKLSFSGDNPDGTEQIELVKMALDEALRKVMISEIQHAQTCIIIMKAYHFLQSHNV